MRSAKRRRRKARPRLRVDPVPLLWVAVALNVVAGVALSPLTAATRVRVVGAPAADEVRIRAELQSLRGLPWARTSPTAVSGRLGALPDARSATFQSNPFGRGLVRFDLRRPAALVAGRPVLVLDAEGQLYATRRTVPEGLRTLSLAPGALEATYTVTGTLETRRLAQLAADLAANLPNLAGNLEVDGRGVVSLRSEQGGLIVFGSTDDLPHKVSRLRAVLGQRPGLLGTVRRLDLTAPDNPVVAPR